MLNRGRFRLFAGSATEYSAITLDLVRSSTVIDMLGLLTLDFKKLWIWQLQPSRFQPADFQKVRDSGITIFHPATGYTGGDVYTSSLSDITAWNRFIAAYPGYFMRVDGPADLHRVKSLGKVGIVIGQQNSSHFRTLDDVNRFYGLGQRVSQLTYGPNRIGGGSSNPHDPGLTRYGLDVLERMNQLGMAADVSHCADRTTLDAIEASTKPVLITHSNCRALVPGSPRCKTDEAIGKLSAKGGVMGITMVRPFVGTADPLMIDSVLDHIGRVVKLAGVEHVGIGTDVDLDGRDHGKPAKRFDLDGVDYARKVFDLTEGLVRRNYAKSAIELILGGNFARALSEIWDTQAAGPATA
jgi:membrane dipeptidase